MRKHTFSKNDRIKKRKQYLELSKTGKRIQDKNFIVIYKSNKLKQPRIGITASKKVGGGVNRNRLKRLIREVYRTSRHHLSVNADINVIVKRQASGIDYANVSLSLRSLMEKVR